MKRRLPIVLLSLLISVCPALADTQKLTALPPIFEVDVRTTERFEGQDAKYIYKEYLRTANADVNRDLEAAVDAFDALLVPLMEPDENHSARKYSRLDIETSYLKTGRSWLSTLIIARTGRKKSQVGIEFTARVYDLETGHRIGMADLFPADSAAWELMSARVREHLQNVFPSEERSDEAIAHLSSPDMLRQAEFSLGGAELTLHFAAKALSLKQPGLIHVRFFYPELAGMMTAEAARQTDNRHWKMVALTCDDGPRYYNSVYSLNNFRKGGARVNYFVVGKLLEENRDILRREFDSNHLIASHSWNHWSGYTISPKGMQKEISSTNAFLLSFTGEPVKYFRAPGGTWPPWAAQNIGLPIIQWSVDTYDYKGKSKSGIIYTVKDYAQHGDVILMHDTGEILNTAIPGMTEYLTDNGFLMVTIEELAWAEGVSMEANTVYNRYFQGRYDERPDSNLN